MPNVGMKTGNSKDLFVSVTAPGRYDLGGLESCIRKWERMNTMVRFKIFIEGHDHFNTRNQQSTPL